MPILNVNSAKLRTLWPFWFKECTPNILVVTDGFLDFNSANGFGLSEFVDTLKASTIHGMTPNVTTATFNPDATQPQSYDGLAHHINNYKFTQAPYDLVKARYDVVFLFGSNGAGWNKLTDQPGALAAVTAFMQAGGGVFATGDHADLGAALCMDIPRVRSMRYWATNVPSAAGADRLSTSAPGTPANLGDDIYQFEDQQDNLPQRLYVNYCTQARGPDPIAGDSFTHLAHPVLQVPGLSPVRAIEVFPDHPHEGECVVPGNLSTKLADNVTDEWPIEPLSQQPVSPEMVALSMSHGNGITDHGKVPVVPRSFIAICAYDGQRANVGRVVTDATWHHFININIKSGIASLGGRDLSDIKRHYTNLAIWLMPKTVRLCLRCCVLIREFAESMLVEELPSPPWKPFSGRELRDIGAMVHASLRTRLTGAEAQAMLDDALQDALGDRGKAQLEAAGCKHGRVNARDTALAALGGIVLAVAELVNEMARSDKPGEHEQFAVVARDAAARGAKLYLEQVRPRIDRIAELYEGLKQPAAG
jgi:hypothetical protein